MSGAKRKAVSSDCSPVKQGVMIKSVNKWIAENDKQLDMTTWLCYEKADREHVSSPKCSICIRFQEKLLSQKNYNSAFITGSKNLRTSSFKDHVVSDMHKHAMMLYKKSKAGGDVAVYAPNARALSVMDARTTETVKKKFEISYFLL